MSQNKLTAKQALKLAYSHVTISLFEELQAVIKLMCTLGLDQMKYTPVFIYSNLEAGKACSDLEELGYRTKFKRKSDGKLLLEINWSNQKGE